ncbi:hypothetical protein GJAV_G00159650 [Gymnothorax javanicus]|nr:hypothetical protein GJAV_G00159650 [Gymnothorax javanicus]
MERPSRNKKLVNYSESKDLDDDEDFACVKAPPNKKARVSGKEPEVENATKTTKRGSKTSSQEDAAQSANRKERLSLDDKLYERDLEAALTLSMLQTSETDEPSPSDRGRKDQPLSKFETTSPSLLLSNCSVDGDLMGLDKITDECDSSRASSRSRQATRPGQVMLEERNGGKDEDYQPTCTPESESEGDDFSGEDESDDEEFTVKKVEKKKPKKMEKPKKEKTTRPSAVKKDRRPSESTKSKQEAKVSSVSRSSSNVPVTITKKPTSSPPVSRPVVTLSPAGGRPPKWNPPAQIGSSPGSKQSIQVKSPGQGLRLGLSRLARVKPLHPGAMGH